MNRFEPIEEPIPNRMRQNGIKVEEMVINTNAVIHSEG